MRRLVLGAVLAVVVAACGSGQDPVAGGPDASRPARTTEDERRPTAEGTVASDGGSSAGDRPARGLEPVGTLTPVLTGSAAASTVPAPLVLADAGNSILYDAEPAIRASIAPGQFFNHTIGGFGLSVFPEVWRGVFGNDVPGDRPSVVVVMMGNRDFPLAIADPDAYRALLDEAIRLVTASGTRVLWLGLPPLPPNPLDEQGRAAVNALYAELPDRFPGLVRYVPTDAALGSTDGSFVRTVTGDDGTLVPVRKRKPDGSGEEHLCPEGAVRLAELIRTEIASIVAVPPAPAGWQAGPWRTEPRYDDPPGACAA